MRPAGGEADGFDCYVSDDLVEFEGPVEIFHRPEGFFADRNYWAPECYAYKDAFYLVTTLGVADRKLGIYVLHLAEHADRIQFQHNEQKGARHGTEVFLLEY